jgi:hypothetical protein
MLVTVVSILATVLSTTAIQPQQRSWSPPRHALLLSSTTPLDIAQHSGRSATITGTLTAHAVDPNTGILADLNADPNLSARAISDVESGAAQRLRFYFPDANHEVTSNVLVTKINPRILQFTYMTPPLNAVDSLNVFVARVTSAADDSTALLATKTKLDLRVALISSILNSAKSTRADAKEFVALVRTRQRFQELSDSLQRTLERRTTVLSEMRFPLQVDNQVAAPGFVSTIIGHFRMSITATPGSAIQGETATAILNVTNLLGGGASEIAIEDERNWSIFYYWQGKEAGAVGPVTIAHGEARSLTFTTPKLNADAPGILSLSLTAVGRGASVARPISRLGGSNLARRGAGPVFGTLSLALPVARDAIAPVWQPGATPDWGHPFARQMQPISARVVDPFGLIDQTSLEAEFGSSTDSSALPSLPLSPPDLSAVQAVLVASLASGQAVRTDVTARLTFVSADQGQSFTVTGDLNPLEEGVYKLLMSASDLAGNTSAPLVAAFVVDRTPPVLSNLKPSATDGVPTTTFVVSGRSNEPLAYASVNGVPLTISSDGRTFSGPYAAGIPGSVELNWEAVDLAGNIVTAYTAVSVPSSALTDTTMAIPSNQGLLEVKVGLQTDLDSSSTSFVLKIRGVVIVSDTGVEVSASTTPLSLDLFDYARGTRAIIAAALVPAGTYRQVDVLFDRSGSRSTTGGIERPLSVPTRLSLASNFTIREGRITQVQVSVAPNLLGPTFQIGSQESLSQAQALRIREAYGADADEMLARAEYVIQGTARATSYWQGVYNGRPMLFTDTQLSVQDRIKDDPGTSVTVTTLGGRSGDVVLFASHVPRFVDAESSIVFMRKNRSGRLSPYSNGKLPLP